VTGDPGRRLPIGVNPASIGHDAGWWVAAARRLDEAGYDGLWCWDHFVSRGERSTPVAEQWVTLTAAAAVTRRATLGTFVVNVMNRHPAVVARMAATLQGVCGGRLVLGIGIGGHPVEHEAYGIPFPAVEERTARLESAVAVIRALWTGGPVSRPDPFYPLRDAWASPVPDPVPPIIVGGETRGGAVLAARIGDGWTTGDDRFELDLPVYLDALAAAGRSRAGQRLLVAVEPAGPRGDALHASAWLAEPRAAWARLAEAGADGVVLPARTDADVDALVEAATRW
jgi:alkanesulfonate monooxygenase SsuD/methylene tetrahydromethanopterin reductase-like flavin-dependent oxidoreductase (luciferase family)